MIEIVVSLVMEVEGERCVGFRVFKLYSWTVGGVFY